MRCPSLPLLSAGLITALSLPCLAQQGVHFTYLWHLEQPIYWPEQNSAGTRYERAWETIVRKNAGGTVPGDNLIDIFGNADRVAAYQYRVKDSIAVMGGGEAGAQITYSGGLIENISSLGSANQLGYGPGWNSDLRTARTWLTSGTGTNTPRLDIVQFSFHHALLPLVDDSAVRKELQLYRRIYGDAWGTAVAPSRGFFPSEMAFSERLIPLLASEGISWSVVSAEKLSRAFSDFPVVFGSGGVNCDPPNRADALNGAGVNYLRASISRGCGPAEAAPMGLTPRRAVYTDPATGVQSSIIVVPASQSMGWKDGYAPMGLGDFNTLAAWNNPARPMLVLLAHDGDNAWGGGYSYYLEATPNLVASARSAGYTPTVIEKYLADHPVPANDYAHVEQGAWVNADGDFGSPQMLNWNWPPLNSSGGIDIENGWHVDIRNWGVLTAANNRVETAEQIHRDGGGSFDIGKVLYPETGANSAERAWHYFLGGLNSGFMYYGTALDMENKPAVASNRAVQYADAVINANPSQDRTGPTIWEPQRHPWNPGSTNFGPQYGYQQSVNNGDFYVYTFAYDASRLSSVTLKYRLDTDGQRAIVSPDNDTYAGGPGVGAWQSLAMTQRAFPTGNVYNDPSISFYATPQYMSTYCWAKVQGVRSKLVDYYIEAVDTRGNVKKSAIQHVWVGDGAGSGGGTAGPTVTLTPAQPVAGQPLTVVYDSAGRPLAGAAAVNFYWGINTWSPVQPQTAMTPLGSGRFSVTVTLPGNATSVQMDFNNGAGTWDNNGGADWRYPVSGGVVVPTWTIDGTLDADAPLLGSVTSGGQTASLWAGIKGDVLYVATQAPNNGRDRFLFVAATPGALRSAMWAKAGQVAGWDAFIGAEASNTYAGWTDQNPGTATALARGTTLEGTINIRQESGGTLPAQVRVALGVYENPDAGVLVSALQPTPTGSNGNGSIEAAEWFTISTAPPCPADLGVQGGTRGSDGVLDNNDFIAFIDLFFAGNAAADMGVQGGTAGSDGLFDNNDFIVFIDRYFAGC